MLSGNINISWKFILDFFPSFKCLGPRFLGIEQNSEIVIYYGSRVPFHHGYHRTMCMSPSPGTDSLLTGRQRTLREFSSDSMKTGWVKIPEATEAQHRGTTPSKAAGNSQIRMGSWVAGRLVKNYVNSLIIDLPAFISCLTNSFNSKVLLIILKQHKPYFPP